MSTAAPKEPNPFKAGYAAFRAGRDPHKTNPYTPHQKDWKRWVNGWQTAQRQAQKSADAATIEALTVGRLSTQEA